LPEALTAVLARSPAFPEFVRCPPAPDDRAATEFESELS
jgi:hypothetical protein